MSSTKPLSLAISLVVLSVVGFIAALVLTLEKFALLENPDEALSCDLSLLVGCSTNLTSAQGSVFGVPNPLLGIAFWAVLATVAVSLLAGASFARWFWLLLNLAVAGALALIVWFIVQSIYVLAVLCPWCMVTWAVTIPAFLLVTLHNLRAGNLPASARVRSSADALYRWIPSITLVALLVIAIAAQLQLDVVNHLL